MFNISYEKNATILTSFADLFHPSETLGYMEHSSSCFICDKVFKLSFTKAKPAAFCKKGTYS